METSIYEEFKTILSMEKQIDEFDILDPLIIEFYAS